MPESKTSLVLPEKAELLMPERSIQKTTMILEAASGLLDKVAAIQVIQTDPQAAMATEAIAALRTHRDELERTRKELTEPLFRRKKAIDQILKDPQDVLEAAEKRLGRLTGVYIQQRDLQLREQREALLRAEQEAMERQAAALASVVDPSSAQDLVAATQAVTAARSATLDAEAGLRGIKTESATSYVREPWTFEVLDLAQVPDQFVDRVPNRKRIMEAINSGVLEIPGLSIYQDVSTTTRRR